MLLSKLRRVIMPLGGKKEVRLSKSLRCRAQDQIFEALHNSTLITELRFEVKLTLDLT